MCGALFAFCRFGTQRTAGDVTGSWEPPLATRSAKRLRRSFDPNGIPTLSVCSQDWIEKAIFVSVELYIRSVRIALIRLYAFWTTTVSSQVTNVALTAILSSSLLDFRRFQPWPCFGETSGSVFTHGRLPKCTSTKLTQVALICLPTHTSTHVHHCSLSESASPRQTCQTCQTYPHSSLDRFP